MLAWMKCFYPVSSRFIHTFTALCLVVGFVGCGDSDEVARAAVGQRIDAVMAQVNLYEDQMNRVISLLETSDDSALVERETRLLTEGSLPILDAFVSLQPRSAAYLNAARGVLAQLDTITEEEIERDYHNDGALPRRPDDGGTTYHVKDLLVHPATVLVLLREEGLEARRDDMINEIRENTAHLESVRQYLVERRS